MKILTNYDFNGNQIMNATIQNLATAPSSPKLGQVYFNTTSNRLFSWNGTAWVGADANDAVMTGSSIVSAINGSSSKIDDDNLSTAVNTAIADAHSTHAISDVTGLQTALDGKMDDGQNISADQIIDGSTNKAYTGTEKTKLSGIATGATANDTDANLKNRANHTGTQLASTISNFAATVLSTVLTGLSTATSTAVAAADSILVAIGKLQAQITANLSTLTGHTGNTSNPHSVTKAQVGLGSVDNTSDANKPISTAAQTALDGKVDDSQVLTNVPAGAVFTDTVYTHPTGDGNLHVPATGTSNNGKVLTAGSTAGSGAWTTPAVAWTNITSKPSSTVANLDAAVTAMHSHSNKALLDTYTQTEANLANAVVNKHVPNTDTGTINTTFTLGSSGVKIKNSSGTELQVRNNADTAYADIRVKNLYVEGDTTTINSQTVAIGDSDIELNSDITTSEQNSDGGITVKRLKDDDTTRADAKMMFNSSTNRWQAVMGNVANTLIVVPVAVKIVATIGDGSSTSFQIPHNLGTSDLSVTIRQIGPPYEQVFADVAFSDDNYITVSFASPPASSSYYVTIIG